MPAAPVGSIMEFTVVGELAGQTIMSVFHYRVASESTKATVAAEQDAFILSHWALGAGTMRAKYLACLPSNYESKRVRAQIIYGTRYRASEDVVSDNGDRLAASAANVAAVITKKTDLSGRKHIGSLHLPIGFLDDVEGGLIQAALKTDLLTLADEMTQNIIVLDGAGLYTPVIYHRTGTLSPYDDITECVPQDTSRVMRRRTVGLGI